MRISDWSSDVCSSDLHIGINAWSTTTYVFVVCFGSRAGTTPSTLVQLTAQVNLDIPFSKESRCDTHISSLGRRLRRHRHQPAVHDERSVFTATRPDAQRGQPVRRCLVNSLGAHPYSFRSEEQRLNSSH